MSGHSDTSKNLENMIVQIQKKLNQKKKNCNTERNKSVN